MIQGTCGPTFLASSEPAGPLSSWVSKLQKKLGALGSTESPLIWKEITTPQGRSIFQLAPSTRRTFVSASTGAPWSTPTVQDAENTAGPSQFERNSQALNVQAVTHSRWPTPTTPSGGRKAPEGTTLAGCTPDGKKVQVTTEAVAIGTTTNGSTEATENRGALAPEFVFWLMGFPDAWGSSASAAMQSLPRLRRQSLKR